MNELTLVVPAAAGGGWDLTAKAIGESLKRERLVSNIKIERFPGAGGLIGLSQFVALHRGQDNVLLLGGLVMLASALRDESAITLRDVAPIARLTGEWDVLVTPTESAIHDVGDLEREMAVRPGAVHWSGGPLGSPDQALVWTIARSYHEPLDGIAYYGRAGGRRVADALLQQRSDVGVSGYAEFAQGIANGSLRVIAVAAPHRIPGIAAPTLRESGLDATMMNWRGVFAAPGLDARQQDRLAAIMAAMARSPSWAEELRRNRWSDAYLAGNPLNQFLEREQSRWPDVVNPPVRTDELAIPLPPLAFDLPRLAALALAVVSLGLLTLWLWWRLRQRRAAAAILQQRCGELSEELSKAAGATGKLIKDGIDEDFGEWNLSLAEADIAWFMLRGLSMREIAEVRGTSERTVRQQAQSVYRKAGLDGRSDLAGRVLERFI